jgi:hypothetical protein
MNTVTKHFRSMLVHGTFALVLAAAGSAWADSPTADLQMTGGTQTPASITSTHQDGNSGEREEGTTADGRRWYRYRYYYHSCYYYTPVCYYHYYYTPVVVWRWNPVVVRWDAVSATNDSQTVSSPDKVSDGVGKPAGF